MLLVITNKENQERGGGGNISLFGIQPFPQSSRSCQPAAPALSHTSAHANTLVVRTMEVIKLNHVVKTRAQASPRMLLFLLLSNY